jgi:hypothetical protein
VSLADALEAAAEALPKLAEAIRPANGDPSRLLDLLAPADAGRVLCLLLEREPDAGEELALAWAEDPRGADPLRGVDEASLAKQGRKALRRAFHRLRSRGIEIAGDAPRAVVAELPKLADEIAGGLMSPPDPSGAQLAVVVEPNPAGGARVYQAVFDLGQGILEFHAWNATRSQARKLLRDLARNARLACAEAPRDAIAAVLARAAESQPLERPLPHSFSEWRSRVAKPPDGAGTPGDLARAALAAEPDRAQLREVAGRVEAGDIGPWPPAPDVLRALAEKVRKMAESSLLVNEPQRRAQVDAVIGDAVESLYAGAGGELAARRFEEHAYGAWKRGQEAEALASIAAARGFRERAPSDNPVARALVMRALAPFLEALRAEQASSLLARP